MLLAFRAVHANYSPRVGHIARMKSYPMHHRQGLEFASAVDFEF